MSKANNNSQKQFKEDYIMIKVLNRKNRIKKELGKSVKIFGKTITVNIIYSSQKILSLI